MSEQEKWEEEAIKEANLHFLKDMPLVAFIFGYLQACRKRQKKWNNFRHALTINAEEKALKIMNELEDK